MIKKVTITGNVIKINNNQYELPEEVSRYIVDRILKLSDLCKENEILKDIIDKINESVTSCINKNSTNREILLSVLERYKKMYKR